MPRRPPQDSRPCSRCGHPGPDHRRATGPDSRGQHTFDQCARGWGSDGYHLWSQAGACHCPRYRPRRLPHWWPLVAIWLIIAAGNTYLIYSL